MLYVCKRYFAVRTNGGHFSKPVISAEKAIAAVHSGASLLVGGFGLTGTPERLLAALVARRDIRNLAIVSNDFGTEDYGLGPLLQNGQVDKVTASYIGENGGCVRRYLAGQVEVELVPQGTIAESIRAGGAGIPYFYTRAGAGTIYGSGQLVTRYSEDRRPAKRIAKKEAIHWNGHRYLKESSRTADFALIKAWKADTFGNLMFRETARNFNPVMARGARQTFVEVEEVVPHGALDPDAVHLPGIYVDAIINGGHHYEKRIMHLTVARGGPLELAPGGAISTRDRIARRAAREFREGSYVNLGIGMPAHASNFIPKGMTVHIDSENGVLGLGPFPRPDEVDPDLVNAGKETVTVFSGASYFGSEESFAMIRGGHFDLSVMGAFEVSRFGDLANWIIPGTVVKGMGGAMDLASSGSRIVITMSHVNRAGRAKVVKNCTLPLTAPRCVSRIITDLCVFDVDPKKGLTLVELAEGESVESVTQQTAAEFAVAPLLGSF